MATEGPLLHDGSMCVANANFYNPGVALAGPGGSGQFLAVTLSGARNLVISTGPTGIPNVYGVLQNTPMAGEACDVGILGLSKVVAGAAIVAGAYLMVDSSGRAITWVSAAGNYKFGIAVEAAGALGVVFTALIFPANLGV